MQNNVVCYKIYSSSREEYYTITSKLKKAILITLKSLVTFKRFKNIEYQNARKRGSFSEFFTPAAAPLGLVIAVLYFARKTVFQDLIVLSLEGWNAIMVSALKSSLGIIMSRLKPWLENRETTNGQVHRRRKKVYLEMKHVEGSTTGGFFTLYTSGLPIHWYLKHHMHEHEMGLQF